MSDILSRYKMHNKTFYNVMNQWMEEGLVFRSKKEKKEKIREGFYHYQLTEKGLLLLEELRKRLSRKKINQFVTNLSTILQDSGIIVSDKEFNILVKKVNSFFS